MLVLLWAVRSHCHRFVYPPNRWQVLGGLSDGLIGGILPIGLFINSKNSLNTRLNIPGDSLKAP